MAHDGLSITSLSRPPDLGEPGRNGARDPGPNWSRAQWGVITTVYVCGLESGQAQEVVDILI